MGDVVRARLDRLGDSRVAKWLLVAFALVALGFGLAQFVKSQNQAETTAVPVAAECRAGQAAQVERIQPGACGEAESVVSQGAGQITVAGAVGPRGPAGAAGVGAAGQTGAQGATGSSGSPGKDGVGVAGPPGSPGQAGATGQTGAAGATGASGQSIVGPAGPAGKDGQSITGPAGPRGETGATGATGATGPQGAQGDPGPSCPSGTSLKPVTFASGQSGLGCVSDSSTGSSTN